MEKDLKMSNLKGLLIFLVVFGHFIEIYPNNFKSLFIFIYSFHMPLFVFVSGYFAKRVNKKKIINLVMVYLIFQSMYLGVYSIFYKEFQLKYVTPYYHLWYLVSMACWYLIALVILKIRGMNNHKNYILAVIVIISIFSRFFTADINTVVDNVITEFNGYSFSYQRTLTFAIFFFLGFYFDKKMLIKVSAIVNNKVMLVLVSLVSIISVLTYIHYSNKSNLVMIFKGAFGVDDLDTSFLPVIAQVFLGYGISICLCFLLLNLVTNKQSILTKWGDHSLQIFLFHFFVVIVVSYMSSKLEMLNHFVLGAVLFIISILVTIILSSKLFIRYTDWLCRPYFTLKNITKQKSSDEVISR